MRTAFVTGPGFGAFGRDGRRQMPDVNHRLIDKLTEVAPDGLLCDEPMAKHTSYGLGGPAEVFVEPSGQADFRRCAELLADAGVPTMIIGRGTNILVRSGGLRGAVLSGGRAFRDLERTGSGVRAGSGVGLPKLLAFCAEHGLAGLEGLAGIPGAVGGAVATNAGSFGVSIGERLLGITISVSGAEPRTVQGEELDLAYRHVELPRGAFIEQVDLRLDEGDPVEIAEAQQSTLEKKWKSQPIGMRSAGCVFRNPMGYFAGRLIEEAGLKGERIGGAVVSDLHANFILNDRAATPEDVERLIELVRERVSEATGVALELEIEIVGERGTAGCRDFD